MGLSEMFARRNKSSEEGRSKRLWTPTIAFPPTLLGRCVCTLKVISAVDSDHASSPGDCRLSKMLTKLRKALIPFMVATRVCKGRKAKIISYHAAVKLLFDRFRMGRTSVVLRSKAIVWSVGLLCFNQWCEVFLEVRGHSKLWSPRAPYFELARVQGELGQSNMRAGRQVTTVGYTHPERS